ncbi:MAG TPA: gluconate 2-dehydrogenase subunit 3 family protein [Bryobacteraceae bacterium]|nr:gluconate 2-dehydrogenase subunit 3 family protein [Bryobacteraceae bacterium]
MRRREFLAIPAAALGGSLWYTLAGQPIRTNPDKGTLHIPLRFFTATEAQTISAACERIFPSDESGPGASEAGVVVYIDRQLAGPYGRDQFRYTKGPFVSSLPEHGYQGKATPREIYREGIGMLGAFSSLSAEQQDQKLKSLEETVFFQMLRIHTIEGMFCDPMHGGNAGMIGWQLIGFPGPQMGYRQDIDAHYGSAFRPQSKSLEQILGHPVRVLEDT